MKPLLVFASFVAVFAATAAAARAPQTTLVRVQSRAVHPDYVAYAVVEPVQMLVVRAATTGTLARFKLKAGDRVRRGERLAHLAGPTYASALASARAELAAARKSNALAQDRLRATQARYPVLSDRSALDRAKTALAQARAGVTRAQAHLAALIANGTIAAPVAGTVAAVLSGNGERVAAGDAIARIQPGGVLWLRGSVYGTAVTAVHVGMSGAFHPAGGGTPIPVRLASLIPGAATDGVGIGLVPVPAHPHWFSGESGLVTLEGPAVQEPVVPRSALILDQGHWWVVKKVKGSFKVVQVKPDFSQGGWTWIASGLRSGTRVVAVNAYLIFHRTFAEQYEGD